MQVLAPLSCIEQLSLSLSLLSKVYPVLTSQKRTITSISLHPGARHHHIDPAYCDKLDCQLSYDLAPRGKYAGSWVMAGILLSCTVWLVPLLVLLAFCSK